MAFEGLKELDNERRCIGSRFWCEAACGNPAASTWTRWRADCGISPGYNRANLTYYEAFLIHVRAHLREFCTIVKMDYPPSVKGAREWGDIAPIADAYAHHLKNTGAIDTLKQAALITEMNGQRVLEVAHLFAGESRISESTVRRRLKKAGITLKKGKTYSIPELRKMSYAIADLGNTSKRRNGLKTL
jgi:hypothetical protein